MSPTVQFPRWQPADDDRLRKLSAQRLSLQEIANALGRTRAAVAHRRHQLGVIHLCIADDATFPEIANRYERGQTNGIIARDLGLAPRVVIYAVRRAGAVYPPTTLRLFRAKPFDDEMLRLRSEGLGLKEIGAAIGLSHRSVAERLTTLDRHADALEMTRDRRRAA